MDRGDRVSCVLCQLSEETRTTGALSTKDEVTAHQNCLLFSSGIYCRDSPHFDDLFGFSVEDVMNEVKRGNKLICNKCKRKGATAGCEVRRCKKSYHYPCAVQEGAKIVEDADKGKYGLYCTKHYRQIEESNRNECVSSSTKPQTSKNHSEAGPSKGNISLESLSNSIITLYCDKHSPLSIKRNITDDSTVVQSVYSSDSNSPSDTKRSKRRLSFNDKWEEPSSKIPRRTPEAWKRTISDNSSNSDENECNAGIEIFAPLEFDLDDSANSVPESQLISKDAQSPTGSTSGNQLEAESRDEKKNEDETIIHSDAESESLLRPVEICIESQSLSPIVGFPRQTASAADPCVIVDEAGEVENGNVEVSSPEQSIPQECSGSNPRPSIDSLSFWKSCNSAGCTQAIFTDFINEMRDISSRIQSDQASQEDYDLALKVMAASGKLAVLVAKQQKDLQRKQMELQMAAAAMEEVVSSLRR